MKRQRLVLQSTVIPVVKTKRPKDYLRLRYWWLSELLRLRAKKRITGVDTSSEKRVVQRELVRLRREYP